MDRLASCWTLTFLIPLLSLQRQVAGEVQTQPHDRTVNQIAMMLAIMGLSLSYYSAKQMTEKVHVRPAAWRSLVTPESRDDWTNENRRRKWRWRQESRCVVCLQTALFSTKSLITPIHWLPEILLVSPAELSGSFFVVARTLNDFGDLLI